MNKLRMNMKGDFFYSNGFNQEEGLVFSGEGIRLEDGDTRKVISGNIYSDRLLQWDFDKHDELCMKHWGNRAQIWRGRSPESIQAFIADWIENPTVKITQIMTGENASNGYPWWSFSYEYIDLEKQAAELAAKASVAGVEEGSLDDMVHDTMINNSLSKLNEQPDEKGAESPIEACEHAASEVNNSGTVVQILYLLKAGVSEKDISKELGI